MNPDHPVYIISKGRATSRQTAKALEAMGVPYHIVVEPQEVETYAEHIDPGKILTLPFSNLGKGSIPARNWVWQHSIDEGHEWHWILDDNIRSFHRFNKNTQIIVNDGTIFKAAEDFVGRYSNVLIAGFNYYSFLPRKWPERPPFLQNTRIYSCILIRNDLDKVIPGDERWRGKYNEDTDLSLRVLKAGYCTILFNAFLANKSMTMKMKGGNTDELYNRGDESRLEMTESLIRQHPDVVMKVRKYGHWHHRIDYRGFKRNKLKRRSEVVISPGVNDYGMKLINTENDHG